MDERSIPELAARPGRRRNPLTRSFAGIAGLSFLVLVLGACLLSLPWTLGSASPGSPRYDFQDRAAWYMPPSWVFSPRLDPTVSPKTLPDSELRRLYKVSYARAAAAHGGRPTAEELNRAKPFYLMGTDLLGRDVFVRCLTGGGISLVIGIAAAMLSVVVGTLYGAIAGYVGGRTDAVMMRVVDVLYGLPYVLLVVLLAVAVDARVEAWQTGRATRAEAARAEYVQTRMKALPAVRGDDLVERSRLEIEAIAAFGSGELSPATRQVIGIVTLLVAIGGVSWLTMARVIRGQVLSLKAQPFMEAARAIGVPVGGLFRRHLLPNLVGPIVVYATLTVPQAILQESFLSFLGIGVKPPLPSWGNLAADGLMELNVVKSNWWLLVFPCLLLGTTLLALNFVGESMREAFDPKLSRGRA